MSVEVTYLGHFGNNLFQYALGRIIAEAKGLELNFHPATEEPNWGEVERRSGIVDRLLHHQDVFEDLPQHLPGERIEEPEARWVLQDRPGWTRQGLNLGYLMRSPARRVVLEGYFQRSEYYLPHREAIRRWFRFKPFTPVVQLGPDDVVVHLRRSMDMRVLDRTLPVSYYRQELERMGPKNTYVCGTGIDAHVMEALGDFRPQLLDANGIDSFRTLTSANRILMANSTFSWWAAFLSDAREVVFPHPVQGFFSVDTPEIALDVAEPRYHYVEDIEPEIWAPVAPNLGAKVRVKGTSHEGLTLEVTQTQGARPMALKVPAHSAKFCLWALARAEPFGPREMRGQKLGVFRQYLGALRALGEAGVVNLSPELWSYVKG